MTRQSRRWRPRHATRGWPGRTGPSPSSWSGPGATPTSSRSSARRRGTWPTGPSLITADEVARSLPLAIAELDDGFFRVRAGRTTDLERLYLRAMAELGAGPVRSAEVAALLHRTTNALGPTRDNLIKRSLCYSPRRGDIEFTVPLFDEFMKRWIPTLATGAGVGLSSLE